MIGLLRGNVVQKKTGSILLEVGGVGYIVFISLNTYYQISDTVIQLFIHTYVKEDRLELFGFISEKEKSLFLLLLKVPGVGPNVALAILSGMDADQFVTAIEVGDVHKLTAIPGIGKTKAEKLIFELKNKIKKFSKNNPVKSPIDSILNDALEALVSLGFDEKKANKIVSSIYENKKDLSLEELIKRSLADIS